MYKTLAIVALLFVAAPVQAFSIPGIVTDGAFTFRGKAPSGTYAMEQSIVLGTFAVFAERGDLDGKTFRIDSSFSKNADLSKPRSVGLMYDCPAIIKRGSVGVCTAKVRFVEPGVYYYSLQNASIEKVGATAYEPLRATMPIGTGVLRIPLF